MTAAVMPMSAVRDRRAEVGLALAVVFIVALLMVPLPGPVLDLLITASIASSLVILLVALQTKDPLEFSSFPQLLLLLTLFRLALNVSSTRLILAEGHAGAVIAAFGQFVIGGNYAVGIVLFLILVGINFIVITKGAGRVAEVAARFTLDAMPGKQMAIDADLSAGLIDEHQARKRREEIARAADFYGAMDGSSKFVKGDAVAGLLITAINIVGGIFIGAFQRGMPISQALSQYTVLTVGDGLVTQIPALIISTAAGIMVTHVSSGSRMGPTVALQLGAHPRALYVAASVIGVFGLVPGLPKIPFFALAFGLVMLARAATSAQTRRTQEAEVANRKAPAAPAVADPMADLLQIDPIELEIGYGLIPLADEKQNGDLLDRISMLRKQAAQELGILVPAIRIRDDIRLPANEYVIKLRGAEIARAEVMPRFLLALDTGRLAGSVDGIDTQDPSFGMPAKWMPVSKRTEAEAIGYIVVEPATVVATHLMERMKSNAADLLGRQDVQEMVDMLKKTHPALVEDVIPAKVSLGIVHRVLQRLLKERVPIRDLVTILEAIADGAEQSKDPEALTEHARRALSNSIARLHMDEEGVVRGIALGPKLEASLTSLFSPRAAQTGTMLTPATLGGLLRDLELITQRTSVDGRPLPLLAPPSLRVGLRRLIEPVLPQVPVVSLGELNPHVRLSSVATWETANA